MKINTIGGAVWVNLLNTHRISNGLFIDALEDTTMFREWLKDNSITANDDIDDQKEEYKKVRDILVQIFKDQENHFSMDESLPLLNEILKSKPIIWEITGDVNKLAFTHRALEKEQEGFVQIVQSFLETIDQQGLDRVRQCRHEECILYFLGTSKAGRRRWCNMETCGNRNKAYKHYQKQKRQKSEGDRV